MPNAFVGGRQVDQAQIQVAGVDLKRYRLLSSDDGVSKQTLDQQQALVNQLQATVKGNQAAIANAEVQLSYTQIRSPVTGRVGIRNVDPGNLVRTSDAQGLFSVTQIDPSAATAMTTGSRRYEAAMQFSAM